MAQAIEGDDVADSESLSVVSDRNGYELAGAVRGVTLFESLSVVCAVFVYELLEASKLISGRPVR